nr:hypothetical protein [Tanacetum cinerariifolium]
MSARIAKGTSLSPSSFYTETEDEIFDSDAEREGHGLDDDGHGLEDEGHGLDDEGHGLDDEGHGLEDESWALRRCELALGEGSMPSTFEVGQSSRFRSLERENERATLTFGVLWRPVLALEAWAGHVDTRMEEISRARYDNHRLIHDMLVQHTATQRELQEIRGHVAALE